MAFIITNDEGRADAALVRQFRQAPTERERTAVFAEVVRQHGGAVLGCCAERLWPDADAAVLAAGGVLIAARRAMADPAKLARPDLLRGWLLGVAACVSGLPGLPAGIDDIDWEAVVARVASGTLDVRASVAERPSLSLRLWLERVVATLPEARQGLYDLFVARGARGADSRSAARELGMSVAGVQRLRRENRQAILRAFEITALVAAAADPVDGGAPGCGELLRVVADAQRGGDVLDQRYVVVPAALRLAVTRHVSHCGACQERRDDVMTRWAPELLPILAEAELREHVMDSLRPEREFARAHAGAPVRLRSRAGAQQRGASVGAARAVVTWAGAAAAGTGVLAALLLLGFVWPGLLHGAAAVGPRGSGTSSLVHGGGASGGASGGPSGSGASGGPSGGSQRTTGTSAGVRGHNHRQPVPHGTAGLLASVPAEPSGSWLTPASSASATPPLVYTVQPSVPVTSAASSGSPSARPTSVASPTSSPAPSPSPSAAKPTPVPSTSPTSPAPSTPAPTTQSSTPTASASATPSAPVSESVSSTALPPTSASAAASPFTSA